MYGLSARTKIVVVVEGWALWRGTRQWMFDSCVALTEKRGFLTIIPRARMGSESRAHEAEGHEGEKNNCFSKIQLVGQKYRDKTT